MAPKVFLTGATGYIGGTAHAYLAKAHPDWEFTLFVRNEERAKPIKAAYPASKFVYGSLDDAAIIEKAAADADIVVHTADSADSAPIATAIARGLAAGHTPERPGYWLHLTGTGMLMWYDARHGRFGEAPVPEQTYRDVDDIDKLVLEIPDEAIHRKVDKIVQAANSDSVRVAIIAPPAIYDQGSGQVNTRSIQVPDLVRATLNHGFGPIAGAGLAEWDNVNVQDLGDLYVKLADATQDPSKQSNEEIFGRNGYFFALGGTHKWSDVTRWIVEEATKHGSLAEPVTRAVSLEEVTQWEGIANVSWGWNSKSVAQRAKKYLGWEPKGRPLRDVIAGLVDDEAKLLSLKSKA